MEDRYLFNAKRIDNGEWVEGYLIYSKKDCYICEKPYECMDEYSSLNGQYYGFGGFKLVDPSTICQCTGLTDKNGQKIWENDIVDYLGHKGKVKYECGSFGIVFREIIDWEEIEANICPITGCDNSLYACENDNFISLWEIMWNFNDIENSIETIEVIGNIFDNPELLESDE